MLQLKNIVKTYVTGEITQNALNGVSVSFRENEFVSILGQSGSGKTTLLNIVGGLDRYTEGDLIINGISTKAYTDADWDYYRNDSIGFVFQSYNLIPHQSVLANVEMALTLAGVSKKERRERAVAVLERVGLKDHIHKKPNQMSGGQMQRVAIARALINNPDILLADEPTGALDSETSIQIMELLKEIAEDKLVIMVTHNPELAEKYSTRIVRLKDGEVVGDTDPFVPIEKKAPPKRKKQKISMSFLTALSLSFNNLKTKKGRTVLTSFAGSIGIIGIALILALSTGMNTYIANVQKDTMASYPITISSETIDISGIMGVRGEIVGNMKGDEGEPKDGVHADYSDLKTSQMLTSSLVKNNLTAFKKYLDDENSEIHKYLGENGIIYSYNVSFDVYSRNADNDFINSDADIEGSSSIGTSSTMLGKLTGSTSGGADNFSELTAGQNGKTSVSQAITDSYDVLYGSWPKEKNEVVLVLNSKNGISAGTLYKLGLITKTQYDDAVASIKKGEDAAEIDFSYEEVCKHVFYLVTACDKYEDNGDGTFSYIEDGVLNADKLQERALELKISGVVRPKESASGASISTAVAYTAALTDYVVDKSNESAVIKAQEASPEINVLTGMQFASQTDEDKAKDAKTYLSNMNVSEKASFYKLMMYYSNASGSTSGSFGSGTTGGTGGGSTEGSDTSSGLAGGNFGSSATGGSLGTPTSEEDMAKALDLWLASNPDEKILVTIYDKYIGSSTYEDNMSAFGKVSYDAPASISIYIDTFENKDYIADCINKYNETAEEDARITYTDYVALLTSSLTTVINGISYVLVAFVSISLVVSCIMIGIITHISVMERTKEIGILRALGASKRNVSQVFNAETFIIGCCAGVLGIVVSLLLMIPINAIISGLTGIAELGAILNPSSAFILIGISILITILGGLLPAKKAAKKDPVVALRTE